jgi:hypothetical protein
VLEVDPPLPAPSVLPEVAFAVVADPPTSLPVVELVSLEESPVELDTAVAVEPPVLAPPELVALAASAVAAVVSRPLGTSLKSFEPASPQAPMSSNPGSMGPK